GRRARGQRAFPAVHLVGGLPGGTAVAVSPVDDALGPEQRGHRLTALADIGELAPHQRRQDAPAAMRGEHRPQAHPRNRGQRPGHPHLEAVDAGPADHRLAVERHQGAVEFDPGEEVGVRALGRRRAVERVLVHKEEISEFVFGDRADWVGAGHVRLPTGRARLWPTLYRPEAEPYLPGPHPAGTGAEAPWGQAADLGGCQKSLWADTVRPSWLPLACPVPCSPYVLRRARSAGGSSAR